MNSRFLPWYSFLFCIAFSGLSCSGGETGLFCKAQSDCTQPDKPICSLAICTGCSQDKDCIDNWAQRRQEAEMQSMSIMGTPALACEASTGSCRECLTNDHCAAAHPGEPLLRVCKPETRTCVGCLQPSDCAANAAASADGLLTCNTATNSCIDCMTPSDCNARPGMPYCVSNRCSACEQDSNCTGVAGKPYCDVTSTSSRKQCVSCTGQPATFCATKNAANPVCNGGTCGPCSKHEECGMGPGTGTGSGICYRPGDYAPPAAAGTLTVGQCIPESLVKNVNPTTIAAELGGTVPYLRLADGSYPDLSIGREVVLVGSRSADQTDPTVAKAIVASVTVTAGRVTLYDLRVERPDTTTAKTLVLCSGGRVQTRLTRLINGTSEYGINASTGCQEVRIAQSYVQSGWQALLLTAPSLAYSVTNSLIARSGTPGGPPFHANAVELGGTATGTFAFNTLYMNERGVTCNNSQAVANSAIVGGVTSTSTSGCTKQSLYEDLSAVAATDYVESPAGVFHPSTAMQTNLKGKAMQALNPTVTVDLFGAARPRPTASTPDIGCEELP